MMDVLSTKASKDSAEYKDIPALGRHYSDRWTREDLMEEQSKGHFGGSASSQSDSGGNGVLGAAMRRIGGVPDDELMVDPLTGLVCDDQPASLLCGSFTERLVSCLISEKSPSAQATPAMATPKPGSGAQTPSATSSFPNSPKPLGRTVSGSPSSRKVGGGSVGLEWNLDNVKSHRTLCKEFGEMEIRLRQALYDIGLLDTSYLLDAPEQDDEVLEELKKQQMLLKSQIAHNNEQKKKISKAVQAWNPKYAMEQAIHKCNIAVEQAFLRRLVSIRMPPYRIDYWKSC